MSFESKGEQNMQSTKSKKTAIILDLLVFIGLGGLHRFYVGKIGSGILYLLTLGLGGIGSLVDLILLCTNKFTDKDGNILADISSTNVQPVPAMPYQYTPSQGVSVSQQETERAFYVNPSTKVFHSPLCIEAEKMKRFKQTPIRVTRSKLIREGYHPCKKCNP